MMPDASSPFFIIIIVSFLAGQHTVRSWVAVLQGKKNVQLLFLSSLTGYSKRFSSD